MKDTDDLFFLLVVSVAIFYLIMFVSPLFCFLIATILYYNLVTQSFKNKIFITNHAAISQESFQPDKPIVYFFDFIFIAAAVIVYHSFFWNKYLPIQEGWFNAYAVLMQKGQIPYRDFYFFLQPLYPGLIAFITNTFGNTIIVLREYGLLERVALAILLYLLYRHISDRKISIVASIVSLIYYTGNNVDVIYSYYQTCILFSFLSTYCVVLYIGMNQRERAGIWFLPLAGFLGGLAFLTKQTTGLIVPFSIFVVLIIFAGFKKPRGISRALLYFFGFLTPIIICYLILYRLGALHAYFNQVFFSAAGSKGGIISVLFGAFIRSAWQLLIALPFVYIVSYLVIKQQNSKVFFIRLNEKLNWKGLILTVVVIFLPLFFANLTKNVISVDDAGAIYSNKKIVIFIVYEVMIFLVVFFGLKVIFSKLSNVTFKWLLLSVVATAIIFAHGLSAAYEEHALILGLGLFIVLLYSLNTPFNRIKNSFIFLFCMLLIFCTTIQRYEWPYEWPYEWWGWRSSITIHWGAPPISALRGMKMSPEEYRIYENINNIIQRNTTPTDNIYVFPHMPIFYLISNRFPATWSLVDYFDVCSDTCAEEDAIRIQKAKPKIIILEVFPEAAWKIHEDLFRKGKPSGQRKIILAINDLITRYHYKMVASYPSTVSADYVIQVWVRADKNLNAVKSK